uniref:ubiquitin carboxyl-terminal hydrolase isozyme L3 isoform X4 n=1 Tax=Myodes glareolus TaxID=447135 RepID=UPI002020BD7D|nr:ubiquitin carboxyl-terminal hydrolase isozyme L3 isoform X4 [Myodes glareolus]
MEPELLSMVPRPVCAVLLLFPITEKYEVFRTEEEEKIKSQGQDVTSSVYFMKQTISNACGTIGLIHAIANNKDKMNFESGSTLKKFLEESVSMSPEERAKYLENYDAIRVTHETSAHEGQTEQVVCFFPTSTYTSFYVWSLGITVMSHSQDKEKEEVLRDFVLLHHGGLQTA